MQTKEPVPSYVTPAKVLEWTFDTPRPEGVHIVNTFKQECVEINWLLFYCWCYSRTNGFLDECCKEWDYGKLGEQYESSRDGIRDALSEFLKYDDTDLLENKEEVEKLYFDCCVWCESEVHKPVPEPEKPPVPVPAPVPEPPAPIPEPTPEPTKPPPQAGGFDWRALLKIGLPILKGIVAVAGAFLPGWVKIILDIVLKVADNIS
jgi:hypothetical protein